LMPCNYWPFWCGSVRWKSLFFVDLCSHFVQIHSFPFIKINDFEKNQSETKLNEMKRIKCFSH
jgi:hypothetical protein